jgi:hypothetical protein
MVRRLVFFLPAVALCVGAPGCNGGLTVKTFVGSVVQMSITGSGVTAPGTHLEVWTRNQNNDILRVDSSYTFPDPNDHTTTKTIYTQGLQIRAAVDKDDPCMIDGKGNLLVTPAAYQQRTVGGNVETAEEQAQSFINRISQLTSTSAGGQEANTLLAVVPYDETPLPAVTASSTAAERLAACKGYWDKSPLAYTGNPPQVTAPLHGTAYGFVSFTTTRPVASYDGIRLDSPTKLDGAQELWLSVETAALDKVDGDNQGPVFLEGKPSPGGNGVIHFDLTGPSASGDAAIYVNLDDPGISF